MNQWPVAHLALTDNSEQTLVAAPPVTSQITVHAVFGSNGGAALSRLAFKDGAVEKFAFAMAANGGGFAVPLPRPWTLAPGTALKVQQSVSGAADVSVSYELSRAVP